MAKKTKPIKTDLFKFVTLRTPQLIDEQKKDIGFIFHNSTVKSTSKFLKTVVEATALKDSRTIVKTAIQQFVPLKSYLTVKAINPKMYNYSSWLMQNRNLLFREETNQRIAQVLDPVLTKAQENKLWDNLYYQVLTRESSYVRQACIQMLVAHNFLAKNNLYNATTHKFTEEEYLVKLANAKVVIDKAFTKDETKKVKTKSLNKQNLKNLKTIATKYYAKKAIRNYTIAKEDLLNIEKSYKKEYKDTRDKAYENYETANIPLIDAAVALQKTMQGKEDSKAISENREPKVISLELDLPKFDFSFDVNFATKYYSKLNSITQSVLTKHEILAGATQSFSEVKEIITNETKKITQLLFNNIKKVEKKVLVNGNAINTRAGGLSIDCFNIYGRGHIDTGSGNEILNEEEYEGIFPKIMSTGYIHLTINLGNNAVISSESHTLTTNGSTTNTSTHSNIISTNNDEVTLNLFPAEDLDFPGATMTVAGTITLNNGDIINYTITLANIYDNVFGSGCGTRIIYISSTDGTGTDGTGTDGTGTDGTGTDGTGTDTQGTTEPEPSIEKLYGVGKIGIADFRKVEQEVCCYVAGEVSHIENILAREYKKRETRNLVSIENTVETTSEKEVENLTDTSTSERNELQSEISSVLNEDQSSAFVASAGVTGKFGQNTTFNANAATDFANSSSSSQSNSEAQIYAQEITERTLERIVQKTSTKRSSRILKEFEEKNEHGFDNRDGTEHVSGVYRWIDIIYKNQLVNYGKRMMYEFMVPEPSRFFKDAIKQNNDTDFESCSNIVVLEKPIHPSELEEGLAILDATKLNNLNYQKIASIYNADVKTYPNELEYAGVTLTKSQVVDGADSNDNKALNEKIDIPENYKAVQYKVSGFSHADNGHTIKSVITVGSKTANLADLNTEDFVDLNGTYYNEVPVSCSLNWIWLANINVVVKCELTNAALQQWQNDNYNAIIDAYNEQLAAYYDAKKEACANSQLEDASQEKEDIRFSNSFNRTIEKREIKRICIEMMALPYKNPMGQDNYMEYDANANELPVVNKNANFENHAAHVKFFEQAFDWEIMAYLFYPYYWANNSDWKDLFKQSSASDPIFQAFLQSGMARAVVPVRPGFEDAVNYYMETGDIWNGGDLVIDQENDLYISIANEMQNIEGTVEKEWETRVPTALTMIQKDTIGLDEEGLPCCDFVLGEGAIPEFENSIVHKNNVELGSRNFRK